MTKKPQDAPLSPPQTAGRARARQPFTPRVTPVEERVEAGDARLEFESEEVAVRALPPRPAPIVRFPLPAAAAPTSGTAPAFQVPRRLIWLVGAIALCVPTGWLAVRAFDRAPMAPIAQRPAPRADAPTPTAVLAAASSSSGPVAAAVAAVEKRAEPPRSNERTRARSRDASRPAGRRSAPAPAPGPPAPSAAAPDATGFYGSLVVDSDPPGARVFVNGSAAGVTPLVLEQVRVGSRVVRVVADGYQTWSSAVRVVANEQSKVVATLRR